MSAGREGTVDPFAVADGSRQPAASTFQPFAPDALEPLPAAIGKYRPIRRLGAGAMGIVYLCSQTSLERPVAVKVMIAGRHASPEQIRRFRREAWAAAQLAHPSVLQIYDIGEDGELNYFVMEYVDGWSLDRLIKSGELTLEQSLRVIHQVALALAAAHGRGIIHRDIKPSNILIDRSGQPKLADFGLAKALRDGADLSGSGDIIGTPQYMAPEQALAVPEELDQRVDIYSLGAVFYEMLTGRPPVDGRNALAVLRQLIDEEPVALRERNPAIPEEVAAVCHRALSKDREARFASAEQFADAVALCLQSAASRAPLVLAPRGLPAAPAPATLFPPPARWRARRIAPVAALALGVLVLAGVAAYLRALPASGEADPDAETLAVAPLSGPSESLKPSTPASPAARRGAAKVIDPSERALALARDVLQTGGSQSLVGTITPRERLKNLIEDLTSVLKTSPDHPEARLLRASAYRRAGEALEAAADFSQILRREPKNLGALAGRLIAYYQPHILYLGNLHELVLRPLRVELVEDDIQALRSRGDPTQRYVANLIDALARQDYTRAAAIAASGLPTGARPGDLPDVLMVQTDALFHAAEDAYADERSTPEGPERDHKRRRREDLAQRANRALRRGLDADPHHVGLLFLQADRFQRLAVLDAADEEEQDRATMIRRQRLAFDAVLDRLRQASLMGGCSAAVARAVLLSNFGRDSQALDRAEDALSYQPTIPYLHTLKAWLRLQVPPDGVLTVEEVDRILHDYQVAFDRSLDDFNPFFLRALLHAAAGRWADARQDLRTCRRKLGKDTLPTLVAAYKSWFAAANAPSLTRYLHATSELLSNDLPVPDELRARLADELLQRLGRAEVAQQEAITPQEVRNMKGWTHFRYASVCAARNDRQGVLKNVRAALEQHLTDLEAKTFREDPTFSGWNEDPEFVALYKQFHGS
jgi:tetratricopeptide (TPR) repeat protein